MSALVNRVTFSVAPFVFGSLLAVAVLRYESVWLPVVRNFIVDTVRQESNRVVFSGTMDKVRACEFLGVTAMAGKHFSLGVSFDDDITRKTSTRPLGVQQWGPWHVDVAPEDHVRLIELTALHNCFPFGTVHTPLTTINLE